MGRLQIHRRSMKRLAERKAPGGALVPYKPSPRSLQDRLDAHGSMMMRLHQMGRGCHDLTVSQLQNMIRDFRAQPDGSPNKLTDNEIAPMEACLEQKLALEHNPSHYASTVGFSLCPSVTTSQPSVAFRGTPIASSAIGSFNTKTGMAVNRAGGSNNVTKRGKPRVFRYTRTPRAHPGYQVWRYVDPDTAMARLGVGSEPGHGPAYRYKTANGGQQMSWVPPWMKDGPQPHQYIRNHGEPLSVPSSGVDTTVGSSPASTMTFSPGSGSRASTRSYNADEDDFDAAIAEAHEEGLERRRRAPSMNGSITGFGIPSPPPSRSAFVIDEKRPRGGTPTQEELEEKLEDLRTDRKRRAPPPKPPPRGDDDGVPPKPPPRASTTSARPVRDRKPTAKYSPSTDKDKNLLSAIRGGKKLKPSPKPASGAKKKSGKSPQQEQLEAALDKRFKGARGGGDGDDDAGDLDFKD